MSSSDESETSINQSSLSSANIADDAAHLEQYDLDYKMFKFIYNEFLLKDSIFCYVWEQFLQTPPEPRTDLTPMELKLKFHLEMLKNLDVYHKLTWFQRQYFSQNRHFPGEAILRNNDTEVQLQIDDPDECEEGDTVNNLAVILKTNPSYDSQTRMAIVPPKKNGVITEITASHNPVAIAFSAALCDQKSSTILSLNKIRQHLRSPHGWELSVKELSELKPGTIMHAIKNELPTQPIIERILNSEPCDTLESTTTGSSVSSADFSRFKSQTSRKFKHSTPGTARKSERLLQKSSTGRRLAAGNPPSMHR